MRGWQWGREGRGLGERHGCFPVCSGLSDFLTLAGRAGQAEQQFLLEELEERRVLPLMSYSTSLSPSLLLAGRRADTVGTWGISLDRAGGYSGKQAMTLVESPI